MKNLNKIDADFFRIKYSDIDNVLTHFNSRHLESTEVDDMKRIIDKNMTAQTHFDLSELRDDEDYSLEGSDLQIVQDIVIGTILSEKRNILNWLDTSFDGERKSFVHDYGDIIGVGFIKEKNKIVEYKTQNIKVCLKRNDAAKYGFDLITAYPVLFDKEDRTLQKNIEKTNRDLTYLVRQTDTYKNSSLIEKTVMEHSANPNNKLKSCKIRDNVTGKETLSLTTKTDQNTNTYYDIRIPEDNDKITLIIKHSHLPRNRSNRNNIFIRDTDFVREMKRRGLVTHNNCIDLKNPYASQRFRTMYPQIADEIYKASDTIEFARQESRSHSHNHNINR